MTLPGNQEAASYSKRALAVPACGTDHVVVPIAERCHRLGAERRTAGRWGEPAGLRRRGAAAESPQRKRGGLLAAVGGVQGGEEKP